MVIVIAIFGLVIVFIYEIRFRMIDEQMKQHTDELNRLKDEVKKNTEELQKKQDIEPKKHFKLPFFP